MTKPTARMLLAESRPRTLRRLQTASASLFIVGVHEAAATYLPNSLSLRPADPSIARPMPRSSRPDH